MTSGIYAIYWNDNGDFDDNNIIYIGQSIDIEKRMKQHISSDIEDDYPLIDGLYSHFNRSHKIWSSITWKILEIVPITDLNNREGFYIGKYKPQLLNQENRNRKALYDCLVESLYSADNEMDDYYWSYVALH